MTNNSTRPPTIFSALPATFRSFLNMRIVWHLLWPVLMALFVWIGALIALSWSMGPMLSEALSEATSGLSVYLPEWAINWGLVGFLMVVSHLLLALALLPVMYLTFVVLLSLVSLPLIMPMVAQKDYPDVVRRGNGSMVASIGNTIKATFLFLAVYGAGWVLFFVPGATPAIHWLAMANLNRQTFAFDVLNDYATNEERLRLQEYYMAPLLGLGALSMLWVVVPIVNLLTPALAALAYIHYCLSCLRYERTKTIDVPPADPA